MSLFNDVLKCATMLFDSWWFVAFAAFVELLIDVFKVFLFILVVFNFYRLLQVLVGCSNGILKTSGCLCVQLGFMISSFSWGRTLLGL